MFSRREVGVVDGGCRRSRTVTPKSRLWSGLGNTSAVTDVKVKILIAADIKADADLSLNTNKELWGPELRDKTLNNAEIPELMVHWNRWNMLSVNICSVWTFFQAR